jgi:Arm DNA-binding domain
MAKALTQFAIENARPGPARREIPDGKERGLYLVVQPSGGMAWAFRYRIHGRPHKLTIGPYPTIGLAKARGEAARAKVSLAEGDDPGARKMPPGAAMIPLRKSSRTSFLFMQNQTPAIGERPGAF